MHFDQFNAIKIEKLYFFTIHPIFSIYLTIHTFKRKIFRSQIAFLKYTGVCFTKVFMT